MAFDFMRCQYWRLYSHRFERNITSLSYPSPRVGKKASPRLAISGVDLNCATDAIHWLWRQVNRGVM